MSLMDAEVPKTRNPLIKTIILLAVLAIMISGLLAFKFWNYPEESAVTRFVASLEQGDYQKAYKLWQPAPSYSFDDFMHDWGPQGDYGKVRSARIVASHSKGSQIVIVTVRINDQDPPLELVVERNTKSLGYSIF